MGGGNDDLERRYRLVCLGRESMSATAATCSELRDPPRGERSDGKGFDCSVGEIMDEAGRHCYGVATVLVDGANTFAFTARNRPQHLGSSVSASGPPAGRR